MTEATCRRELELEIPAENVQKTTERVARDLARVARVPGFRPGKAPVTLIRRRFADEIKGEVLQSLVPERLEKRSPRKSSRPSRSRKSTRWTSPKGPAEIPRDVRSSA